MPKRSESFDEYIAQKMQNPSYAKATLLHAIQEFNGSVEKALNYTIRSMGIKEFSKLSNIPAQNISDFTLGKRKLKQETLDKYLAVFNLKSKLIVVEEKKSPLKKRAL